MAINAIIDEIIKEREANRKKRLTMRDTWEILNNLIIGTWETLWDNALLIKSNQAIYVEAHEEDCFTYQRIWVHFINDSDARIRIKLNQGVGFQKIIVGCNSYKIDSSKLHELSHEDFHRIFDALRILR